MVPETRIAKAPASGSWACKTSLGPWGHISDSKQRKEVSSIGTPINVVENSRGDVWFLHDQIMGSLGTSESFSIDPALLLVDIECRWFPPYCSSHAALGPWKSLNFLLIVNIWQH